MEGYSGNYSLHDGGQSVGEVMFDGNGTPTLYAFDGFGASGLEWRSFPALSGGGYSAYTFDPQGNVVQPVTLYPGGNGLSSLRVRTSSSYNGFGLGVTAPADGSGMADPVDPIGFGGQHGYYHDYTTGLYLLTHRYYDAGAGRFINRDPIGYKGGINLYGFAGNNPVNESDPSGYQAQPDWMELERGIERAGTRTFLRVVKGGAGRVVANVGRSALAAFGMTATMSVGLFFASARGTADASTGPGSPYNMQEERQLTAQEIAVEKSIARNKRNLEKRARRSDDADENASLVMKAADILADRAAVLGYYRKLPPQPWSHGQKVFSNGKSFISKDIDGHNVTDGWKLFDKKGRRVGTYDAQLNPVKD